MATVVTLSASSPGSAVAGQREAYVVTVANTGAAALTLSSLSVNAPSGWTIAQPIYLTPNVAAGVGNPILSAGGSASYGFNAVSAAPAGPGTSPNNPGGSNPSPNAQTPYSNYLLVATAQTSDGSVASGQLWVQVLTAIAPFPVPEGGALDLTRGTDLVNFLTL